jgi:hypothetical protein
LSLAHSHPRRQTSYRCGSRTPRRFRWRPHECGAGVADGPSLVIDGGLREHAAGFTLARTGALALRSSGPAFGFSRNHGDLDTVHQHMHFRNVLFGNQRQDQLSGAADFLRVPRPLSSVRALRRTASRCPPRLPCASPQARTSDRRYRVPGRPGTALPCNGRRCNKGG